MNEQESIQYIDIIILTQIQITNLTFLNKKNSEKKSCLNNYTEYDEKVNVNVVLYFQFLFSLF
jgi:hypothetical protein